MSHEGRMSRGKANVDAEKLLDNADTLYYLANKPAEGKPRGRPKKEAEDGSR